MDATIGMNNIKIEEQTSMSTNTETHTENVVPTSKKSFLPVVLLKKLINAWFPHQDEVQTKSPKVKMPMSIAACLVTIAISLIMIVGSSAMMSSAYKEVNHLQSQVNTLATRQVELEQELNDKVNLLAIRDVAVNEYGMISEEYISMRYLVVRSDSMADASYTEANGEVRLSNILSAANKKTN